MFEYVPDQFVTQEMCHEAVKSYPWMLKYVLTLRDAYIKCKTQKAKTKEELMPVAWHPDRWWDWCIPEDEKKEILRRWS